MFKNLGRVASVLFLLTLFFEINVTIIQYLMFALILQNLCVTAAHRPIKEILEKGKKVCLFFVSVILRIYGFVIAFDGKLQLGCMHKSFHKVYMLFACVTYLLLPFIF